MAIARKPKSKTQASEVQIATLIDKGGSAARQEVAAQENLAVALRIPGPLAGASDSGVAGQRDADAASHVDSRSHR